MDGFMELPNSLVANLHFTGMRVMGATGGMVVRYLSGVWGFRGRKRKSEGYYGSSRREHGHGSPCTNAAEHG
jgi:hypothetical protein